MQYTVLYSHTVLWAANHEQICHLPFFPNSLSLHSVFILHPWILHFFLFSSVFSFLSPFSHLEVLCSTTTTTTMFMSAFPLLLSSLNFYACVWQLCIIFQFFNILSSQYDSSRPESSTPYLKASHSFPLFLCFSEDLSLFIMSSLHPLLLLILYNPSQCIPPHKSKPVLVFLLTPYSLLTERTDRSLSTGFKEAEMTADVGALQSNHCVYPSSFLFHFHLTFFLCKWWGEMALHRARSLAHTVPYSHSTRHL